MLSSTVQTHHHRWLTAQTENSQPKSTQTQVFQKGLVASEHRQEGQFCTTAFFGACSEANPSGPEIITSPPLLPSPERQNPSSRGSCFPQRGIDPCHWHKPSKAKQETTHQQTGHKTCASASFQYHINQWAQTPTLWTVPQSFIYAESWYLHSLRKERQN